MPHYQKQFPGPKLFQLLLRLYDRLSGQPSRQRLSPADTSQWVPGLSTNHLTGASGFTDAVTDDARLVQRVLEEAEADGAICLNYMEAKAVLRNSETNAVTGVHLLDTSTDSQTLEMTVNTPLVINATGAWADQLKQADSTDTRIRPLREATWLFPIRGFRCPVRCRCFIRRTIGRYSPSHGKARRCWGPRTSTTQNRCPMSPPSTGRSSTTC